MPQHATSFQKAPTVAVAHPVVARCFIVLEIMWPRGLKLSVPYVMPLVIKVNRRNLVDSEVLMKGSQK
jgi:hypothetical protein